ncbi:hypothetical protein NNJEOMEG_03311 [Fundidesulfovibrio magnetotacticus]|uniref:Uncharacterized protein n=1 Tax=Fundidesulfovibrio magnetotacticus TaxID=2730080 RepID=A0A6V8LYY8_9BACT|nr:hypothetical protein [Fundidesulfovibrio magnetotacticus]GFK95448.1 hypothetical protein NNJEOMEG_03311 [Fundidesulfovibrio magnetotacticus]
MNNVRVEFYEDKALRDLRGIVTEHVLRLARKLAETIRRNAPKGRTGKMARGIRVYRDRDEAVVHVPRPARFIELGHDVVVDGRKVGHRPPRPFIRPAIMRLAGDFGESYGAAVGEYAGAAVGTAVGAAVGYRYGGALATRSVAAYGRAQGAKIGREGWTRAGARIADMAEARSWREKAAHAGGAAAELSRYVTARRWGDR